MRVDLIIATCFTILIMDGDNQFGEEIDNTIIKVLKEPYIRNIKIKMKDRGVIDCVILARIETALKKSRRDGLLMRRTMLFMHGNNPGMLINAVVLGADSVLMDLEDAVSSDEKDSARILVRNVLKYLNYKNTEVIIRINSIDTDFWRNDLDEVIHQKPHIIMPPKAICAKDVQLVTERIKEIEKLHNIVSPTVIAKTLGGVHNEKSCKHFKRSH